MNHQTINNIYESNDKIREKLFALVASLSDERMTVLPEGEKWTIANFVEHIAIVEEGMTKISAKLLVQAQTQGKTSDGKANFSENFTSKASEMRNKKFEAPERVRPTGKLSIAESLAKMKENRRKLEELLPLFETVDASEFKFPHPALGELSAHDWLALIGGHEARHLAQIKKILEKTE